MRIRALNIFQSWFVSSFEKKISIFSRLSNLKKKKINNKKKGNNSIGGNLIGNKLENITLHVEIRSKIGQRFNSSFECLDKLFNARPIV